MIESFSSKKQTENSKKRKKKVPIITLKCENRLAMIYPHQISIHSTQLKHHVEVDVCRLIQLNDLKIKIIF